ncbi:MAG TPA: FKBP-type peptidyl-prolyl cis-trans isomerase [Burkholderiales bacterium]|nr:FKBP-type peptidyl-prolyl cis-trans isomerase [Burkholderiales bacterium]
MSPGFRIRAAAVSLVASLFLVIIGTPAAKAAPTEIEIVDRTVGEGLSPRRGWFVVIRYTGWIYDEQAPEKKGRQFIRSDDRGAPVTFVYGYKRALPGIEKGMEGMKVGGKRTVILPAKYAFKGARQESPDGVSVDSSLVLDLELIDVVPQANAPPSNE